MNQQSRSFQLTRKILKILLFPKIPKNLRFLSIRKNLTCLLCLQFRRIQRNL
jgi:hypothetical protein